MFRGGPRGRANRAFGPNRQNLGIVLLAMQILQFGIDRIPLVTLVTLLTNIGVYLHVPELLDIKLPQVRDICISYHGVVVYREYIRLVLSGFYHLSDMHLYYNMASFLYKGSQLEPRLGSGRFASVIGTLLVGSSMVYCALQYCAAQLFPDSGHLYTCAAGFSAVLFGLKVLMQHEAAPSHRLFGIPIHMAYWSELIWISIITPQASFVGHLAGILTGLLISRGPLSFVLTGHLPLFFETGVRGNRTWGSGVAAGGPTAPAAHRHTRPSTNRPTTRSQQPDEDVDIQEAIRRSLQDPLNPGYETGPAGYRPSDNNNIYPDLQPPPYTPSAPPYPVSTPPYPDTTPPYTPNPSNPPYPGHSSHDPSRAPDLPTDIDEIRRRRVQRFQ